MSYSTYSFDDVTMVISHPAVGQFNTSGAGLGSINTTMTTERSAHDVAADGSIMISKIKGRNGAHMIVAQQTSTLHQWLTKLYNYLETAPTREWAKTKIVIRSPSMKNLTTSTGVSFTKLADVPYQAQGQQVTWNLMAADIQQDIV